MPILGAPDRVSGRSAGPVRPVPRRGGLALLGIALTLMMSGCAGDQSTDTSTPPAAAPTTAAPTAAATPDPPTPPDSPTSPEPLPASEPVSVRIPGLDVQQDTIDLGLQGNGEMEVPSGPDPIGWYTGSPTPGERGPAVLAGHLTWNGVDGVFRHLDSLAPGDEIVVDRADDTAATFEVTRVERYVKEEFPTARVYGNTVGSELRLITCAGDVDAESNEFSDNVVVYATLV